jgi:beta-ribofuranosylaminobenzene 5'-phosphate synthase
LSSTDPTENPNQQCWTITCPARLHFGLLEICPGEPNLFGGLGVAIDKPRTIAELQVSGSTEHPSIEIACSPELRSAIEPIIQQSIQDASSNDAIRRRRLQLRIVEHPKRHNGVGSGTQLACAVASLIRAAIVQPKPAAPLASLTDFWNETASGGMQSSSQSFVNLANASGRGLRSYVGLAAHLEGGLIVDHGQSPANQQPRTIERLEAPEDWPVLLIDPLEGERISGTRETSIFEKCARPNPNRQRMQAIIAKEFTPAVRNRDFKRFASALFEYGCLGGQIFEAAQGGIYRDQRVSRLVSLLRSLGAVAVGQTSWGPTVFCIVEHEDMLQELTNELVERENSKLEIRTTRMTNQPAILARVPISP